MEWDSVKRKVNALFKKYKYAFLILLVGLVLMAIPSGRKEKEEVYTETKVETVPSVEERIESILSKIDGAGDVEVLLSQAKGERILYQTDMDESVSENGTTNRVSTVLVTDTQRNENGLIVQVEPPVYLGAIVVSKGADNPSVKLAIVEAVSKITGLGANQITVLKMK